MADDSEQVGQDEVEQLLSQAQEGAKPAEPANQAQAPEETSGAVDPSEIEALLGSGSPDAPTAPASGAMPVVQTAGAAPVSQDAYRSSLWGIARPDTFRWLGRWTFHP